MPMYDRQCDVCGFVMPDLLEPIHCEDYDCNQFWDDDDLGQTISCTGVIRRVWLQGAANGVVDDSIPGGLEIKNALCWPDGTPRRFDSHSEIKREAERTGWTNVVKHIPQRGSDKSPHTVRWVSSPNCCTPELEAARVAAWHAHERQFEGPPQSSRQ